MTLRYLGTGTITIEGFGAVSAGDLIGVSDELGQALIRERPEQFQEAVVDAAEAPPGETRHFAGPRMKRGGGD